MNDDRELIRRLMAGHDVVVRAWGTSMQPAIRPGARLRIRALAAREAIRPGEVVLVLTGEGTVRIHRAVDATDDGVVTRGDALAYADARVRREQVLGRVAWGWAPAESRWQRWRRARMGTAQ